VVWKWRLHTGDEVVMQAQWCRRNSEVTLVEGCKAEAGLHYGDKSSSVQEAIQTQGNTRYTYILLV